MMNASQWQPLSTLSMFSESLDLQLDELKHQHRVLSSVQNRPHVLDEEIVTRIVAVYQEQQQFLSHSKEQVIEWSHEARTDEHHAALEYFYSQLGKMDGLVNQIIGLTQHLAGETMEKVLLKQQATAKEALQDEATGIPANYTCVNFMKYFQVTKNFELQ